MSSRFLTIVQLALPVFCINLAYTGQAQLTITVRSIPASTPPEDDIYISGNFNNWNPGNPSYKLSDQMDGTYSITLNVQQGTMEYKFTRGSWSTVEGTISGGYIPNRIYEYAGGLATIEANLAGWEGDGDHTAADNVKVLNENFYIPQLDRTRRIWVYLPPDYYTTSKRYPVMYMQDGQNLFDEFYSFAGEWKIDESMNDLFEDKDHGAIIVGIDNGGSERNNEYSAWEHSNFGGGDGELYAAFIAKTLKPYIDSTFRTFPARNFTGIAGSSLGANISLYTAIEYQDVFSKVGIFSPAFWFSDSIYQHVINKGIEHEMRIYFVAGDNESTTMVPDMMDMHDTLEDEGVPGDQMYFLHHADGAHSEWYWAREYPDAYEWLFDDLILSHHPARLTGDFIFPNPADKFLRIRTEEFHIPYTIYSPLGDIIVSGKAKEDIIHIPSLPSGVYYIEMKPQGQSYYWFSRFVKL